MPWFWIVAGPNGAGKTTLVEKGLVQAITGHDVPPDKVVSRWSRSITMLGRVADKLDRLFVFDNTRPEGPRLIALGIGRQVTLLEAGRIPEIDAVLSPAGQENR